LGTPGVSGLAARGYQWDTDKVLIFTYYLISV